MKKLGFEVNEHSGEMLGAPGACNECRDGQSGKLDGRYGIGHFLCNGCPDVLLAAEERDDAGCIFTDNSWTWFWYGD